MVCLVSTKPFSRNPIGLALLKQTVNADATSQRTGIASMTNSLSASQRCAESHFLRTTIISKWRHKSNQTGRHYRKSESFKHKDNLAVKEVKCMVENSLNPFNEDADPDCLFNTLTGKSCKKSTEDFLLVVKQRFILECVENPSRIEERIKKIILMSTILRQS